MNEVSTKSAASQVTLPNPAALIECPICRARTSTKKLRKHLNKVHIGAFSEWPRQTNDAARHKLKHIERIAAGGRLLPAKAVKCCICGVTVDRLKDLKKHVRVNHYAPRPPARLRKANVPSSLGRLLTSPTAPLKKFRSGRKKKARSSSVWTVQGGLPESNRRKH